MFPGQAVTVVGPLTKPLKTRSTEHIFEALGRVARKYNPDSDLVERVLGDSNKNWCQKVYCRDCLQDFP